MMHTVKTYYFTHLGLLKIPKLSRELKKFNPNGDSRLTNLGRVFQCEFSVEMCDDKVINRG